MRFIYIGFVALLLAACGIQQQLSSEPFHVYAFKVGKADSLLISHQNEYVLIDTGEDDDGEKILDYLEKHNITSLKALVITHFDKDHVGGADLIVNGIDIDTIYAPNYESDSKQTKQFLEAAGAKGYTVNKVTTNTAIFIGEASGTIYPPLSNDFEGDNDFSLIVSMQYDETSFLFAGDAEAPRLQEFMRQTDSLQHAFLKVPHHGRFNEETANFINQVKPDIALITSSDKNPEDPKTVQALESVDADIYTTRSQNIELQSNGKTIEVK